jgi:hypothetical protein
MARQLCRRRVLWLTDAVLNVAPASRRMRERAGSRAGLSQFVPSGREWRTDGAPASVERRSQQVPAPRVGHCSDSSNSAASGDGNRCARTGRLPRSRSVAPCSCSSLREPAKSRRRRLLPCDSGTASVPSKVRLAKRALGERGSAASATHTTTPDHRVANDLAPLSEFRPRPAPDAVASAPADSPRGGLASRGGVRIGSLRSACMARRSGQSLR